MTLVLVASSQKSGVDKGASRGVQLGDEDLLTVVRGVEGSLGGGEIVRVGVPGHVHVARAIDGDAPSIVVATFAQEGAPAQIGLVGDGQTADEQRQSRGDDQTDVCFGIHRGPPPFLKG
ncbi:hypothetical protein ES703_103776 [subsurface metagenome]